MSRAPSAAGTSMPAGFAERLIDWLDDNQEVSGSYGAEDNQYLLLEPPYRAANRPMQDVSELRLLLELSERDYRRLLPHVSALPAATALRESQSAVARMAPRLSEGCPHSAASHGVMANLHALSEAGSPEAPVACD